LLRPQRLSWARDHVMMLPEAVSAGMVAWTLGANGTSATPACVLGVEERLERGAFTPFVRVRLPCGLFCAHA
jgi:hypothetical protein